MKRVFFYALTILCSMFVFSCGEKKDDASKNDTVLKPDDQKKFLNDVAIELSKSVSASDFDDLNIFVRDLIDLYEDYDWSTIEDNMNSAFDESKDFITSYREDAGSYSNYQYYNHYEVYDVVLMLSNFTGHYTAQRGSWKYTPADDLQFSFKDLDRNDCVLTLVKEGDETELRLPSDSRYINTYSSFNGQTLIMTWNYYYEKLQYVVSVPEKITVSLTRAGENVVTATIMINIGSLTRSDYFDFGRSSLESSVEIVLNNGYRTSWNGTYTANDKLSLNGRVSKSDNELISCVVSGDPSGFPSMVFSDDFDEDEFEDLLDDNDVNVENLYVSASFLSKAKIIGKVADARMVKNLVDKLDKNRTNERRFKEYLNQINEKLDVGLYYNGSDKRQAYLEFEAFSEYDRYEDKDYWNFEPVMVFSDETRVSCEVFFDEDDFRKALDAFEELGDDFEDLVD